VRNGVYIRDEVAALEGIIHEREAVLSDSSPRHYETELD
jgi:hypothetical protein